MFHLLKKLPYRVIIDSGKRNASNQQIKRMCSYSFQFPTRQLYRNSRSVNGKYLICLSFTIPFLKNEKDKQEEEEEKLIHIIKLGILATKKEDYKKAEELLHIALKTAQERDHRQACTYVFDLLANLAMKVNDLQKAETLFKTVIERVLQDGMEIDDNAIVEMSLKLANIYAKKGEYQKAVEGFHFCIAIQESKMKKAGENVDEDTLALWAMSRDWCAQFLLQMNEFDLAKENFVKAYDVCVKLKGPDDSHTAVLLNNLGTVSSLQNNIDEAIQYIKRAIEAAEKSDSEHLPSFYVNLGNAYLKKTALDDAELWCNKGLTTARKNGIRESIDEGLACLRTLKNQKLAEKK